MSLHTLYSGWLQQTQLNEAGLHRALTVAFAAGDNDMVTNVLAQDACTALIAEEARTSPSTQALIAWRHSRFGTDAGLAARFDTADETFIISYLAQPYRTVPTEVTVAIMARNNTPLTVRTLVVASRTTPHTDVWEQWVLEHFEALDPDDLVSLCVDAGELMHAVALRTDNWPVRSRIVSKLHWADFGPDGNAALLATVEDYLDAIPDLWDLPAVQETCLALVMNRLRRHTLTCSAELHAAVRALRLTTGPSLAHRNLLESLGIDDINADLVTYDQFVEQNRQGPLVEDAIATARTERPGDPLWDAVATNPTLDVEEADELLSETTVGDQVDAIATLTRNRGEGWTAELLCARWPAPVPVLAALLNQLSFADREALLVELTNGDTEWVRHVAATDIYSPATIRALHTTQITDTGGRLSEAVHTVCTNELAGTAGAWDTFGMLFDEFDGTLGELIDTALRLTHVTAAAV